MKGHCGSLRLWESEERSREPSEILGLRGGVLLLRGVVSLGKLQVEAVGRLLDLVAISGETCHVIVHAPEAPYAGASCIKVLETWCSNNGPVLLFH